MKNSAIFFMSIAVLLLASCTGNKSNNTLQDSVLLTNYYLLVGTYTNGSSTGIYVYDLNQETGDMNYVNKSPEVSNPSYLAVSGDEKFVYAVSEDGEGLGAVNSFSFDKINGSLKYLNSEKTTGDHPCYVAVNKGNNFVTTANYTGGSLSVFPVKTDGSLESASQVFGYQEIKGKDIPSHIHTTVFSPDAQYLFVTDLGKDKIYKYYIKLDSENKLFLQEQQVAAELDSLSGPRHLAFHPNGNYLYCIGELSGKITVFQYDKGNLNTLQTIASDTTSGTDKKGSADIHLTPDGQFLYASNRLKADGIAIFRVNDDGTLVSVGYQLTGIHPRNFAITPNGKFLLVASRDSNNVCVFAINKETGLLTDTKKEIKIDKPVCLKFISK